MIKLIVLGIFIGMISSEVECYRPRGWRPDGPRFEPSSHERLQTHGNPQSSYGVPVNSPTYPQRERPEQTTVEPATTNEPPSTTTPRSREPTTATPDITDEDVESGPALAIANSFAFNRPVYVYNTYPFQSGLTFV